VTVSILVVVLGLAAGADLVGLPGTKTLNLVLNGGDSTRPPVVLFSKQGGFHFLIVPRLLNKLFPSKNKEEIPDPDHCVHISMSVEYSKEWYKAG
jgi:hypothetical protein